MRRSCVERRFSRAGFVHSINFALGKKHHFTKVPEILKRENLKIIAKC